MIQVILTEIRRGNFSFLILVVGIVQLIVMLRNTRSVYPGNHCVGAGESSDEGTYVCCITCGSPGYRGLGLSRPSPV